MTQIMSVGELREHAGQTVWIVRQLSGWKTVVDADGVAREKRCNVTNKSHMFEWKVGAVLSGYKQKHAACNDGPVLRQDDLCLNYSDAKLCREEVRSFLVEIYLPIDETENLSGIFMCQDEAETRRSLIAIAGADANFDFYREDSRWMDSMCGIEKLDNPRGLLWSFHKDIVVNKSRALSNVEYLEAYHESDEKAAS